VDAEQLRHLRDGVAALADQGLDGVAALEVGQAGALQVLREHQGDRAGIGVRLDQDARHLLQAGHPGGLQPPVTGQHAQHLGAQAALHQQGLQHADLRDGRGELAEVAELPADVPGVEHEAIHRHVCHSGGQLRGRHGEPHRSYADCFAMPSWRPISAHE